MVKNEQNWLVLRCPGSKTLDVADRLAELGVNAWTPIWRRKRRRPRDGRFEWNVLACIPSFVFVADDYREDTDDLMSSLVVTQCSWMRDQGRVVGCPERTLSPLRKISDDDQTPPVVPIPPIGSVRRINDGAFQGLWCKVVGRTASMAVVEVAEQKWFPMKIAPFLLGEVPA